MVENLICSACESIKIEQLSFNVGKKYPLFQCGDCGFKFIRTSSTEENNNASYWNEVNIQVYRAPSVIKEYKKKHSKFLEIIKKRIPPNNNLLDLGCGSGIFLDSARQFGFNSFGIEPDPSAVRLCRQNYNLSPYQGYLEINSGLPKNFGILTAWDVIEHVGNPKQFLEICYSHLTDGGILLLETPDESSIMRKIINAVSMTKIDILDFRSSIYYKSHRYYFTNESLLKLLHTTGFGNISIYKAHSLHSKSYEKYRLYRKYSSLQLLVFKMIFTILKFKLFSNKQIIIASKMPEKPVLN